MSEQEEERPDNGADKYFIGGGEHGFIGKAKACYIIVFDDEPQLMKFYDMIKVMKKMHPEIKTHGGRVSKFVDDFLVGKEEILVESRKRSKYKKDEPLQ
jgi:hypothetical protein